MEFAFVLLVMVHSILKNVSILNGEGFLIGHIMLERPRVNGRESDQILFIFNGPLSTIWLANMTRIFFLGFVILSLVFIEIDFELLENILVLMNVGWLPACKLVFGFVVVEGGVGIRPDVSIFHGNFNIKSNKR